MRCLAAWAIGGLTLAAGLLPDPDSAVASVAVASNLYVSNVCFLTWPFVKSSINTELTNGPLCADGALHALPCDWHCSMRKVNQVPGLTVICLLDKISVVA